MFHWWRSFGARRLVALWRAAEGRRVKCARASGAAQRCSGLVRFRQRTTVSQAPPVGGARVVAGTNRLRAARLALLVVLHASSERKSTGTENSWIDGSQREPGGLHSD